ncbi:MAG: tetratricopeptide repeat protein [Anaerolineae bacterium]|nr:tetratricopeptide repeat protein [Anaerolineae bacterium]
MHLPVERNSFIDRERDVGVLTRQLNMGAHRLVTLTGPYGVGKSRLALRIASQLRAEFADGVWWINLTDVTDSVLVPQSVAVVLHLPEQAEEMLVARLQDRLFARHLLLILDGCDHVINACAELVQTLLAACADLHIVVTTRQPLGIEGESVWTVGPLPISPLELPDPLDEATLPSLLLFSGIRLFVERAQAAQPAFQLTPDNARAVVEVCHYLDGIPLALELAAQRVKVMAVQQMPAWRHDILGLLEGVSPKSLSPHPSLRAALDYSYDHLGSEEQRTLSALSIFEDGATFEAIQWVCGEDVPALAVLDTLSRLVDKSLITLVEHRGVATYRMLEVMRQYCRAKLDASGETDTLHRRQATFYATLAEQADRELQGPKQALWLGRLEREHTHLRAALTWVMEQGETALLLRLAGHLWRFWEARGHIAEGRQWLEQTLTLVEASSSLDYARALHGAAVLAHNQSDLSRARWLHEACLALRHQLDDRQGSAVSLLSLGLVAKDEGDHERAASLYQESLGLFRRLNDSRGAAEALLHMGLLAHIRGNAQQATPMIEESLALFRRVEDKRGMALALSNLGLVTRNQGRYQRAQRLHEEALALRRELDDKVGIALSLANLGLVAQDQGHFAEAVRNQEQSLARFRELGAQWGIALLLNTLALAAIYQEDYDQAAALSRESWELYHTMGHQWGIAMVLTTLARIDLHDGAPQRAIERVQQSIQVRQNIHDSHGLAECLETLAIVWASQGHGEQAMWLDGAATALREQIHAPRSPTERAELNHWFEGVYPNSNEAALMLAWDEGHYTSVEQAIETALALILTSPSQVNAASSSLDPPVEPELRNMHWGGPRSIR